jgi:hypothetical protein
MDQSIELLLKFNQDQLNQANIVYEVPFIGDDLGIDHKVFKFYKCCETPSSRIGGIEVIEIGVYRQGDFFKGSVGFSLLLPQRQLTLFPISERKFFDSLIINYQDTHFYGYGQGYYESLFECPRYWTVKEENIIEQYPEEWNQISSLCLGHIRRLSQIGKEKDYKSGWMWHQYRKLNLDKTINDLILKETEFYYSSEIFYNKFSGEFFYISSLEREELEQRRYRD